MATQVKLAVERREATGRSAARKLKARGIVPAVVYGGREKPEPLQLSRRDLSAVLSHASGENILVELEIAGEGNTRMAMVQEVQHSPVGGDVLHVDFHAVSMDEKIEAGIPIDATGTANGVKNFGGLLEQSLRELTVECLPRDLPDRFVVDVTNLNVSDSIHVRDIKLPEGVISKVQADLTVFSVLEPTVEEEPAAATAATTAAGPEVIKEKKEEGEATAAPAGGGAKAAAAPAKEKK
ncbi:MAG: 50S ribosomal protein L25 [Chthoniobacterales bacterium]|nr:MAG: 50S ribosomal protein L25 [Chthoniobacterales bacterium]